jgi:hypothetical protein
MYILQFSRSTISNHQVKLQTITKFRAGPRVPAKIFLNDHGKSHTPPTVRVPMSYLHLGIQGHVPHRHAYTIQSLILMLLAKQHLCDYNTYVCIRRILCQGRCNPCPQAYP